MRILISAFSCAPNVGSEAGGAWNYVQLLSREHDVWVITDIARKNELNAFFECNKVKANFIFYRPAPLRNIKLNSFNAKFIYQFWLNHSWKIVEELDRTVNFDFTWHISYGVFRQPPSLWKVNKPFIFGPVGGGESVPKKLRASLLPQDYIREYIKDFINRLALHSSALKCVCKRAALIISRTEDTRRRLETLVDYEIPIQQEIGCYISGLCASDLKPKSAVLKVLFVGRLLGFKGVHFAISAIKRYVECGNDVQFTIIGSGPMKSYLSAMVTSLELDKIVSFIPNMSQQELFKYYQNYDVFLFPSLSDSGGNVVIEALSFGLPVICSDSGGPSQFVDKSCGYIVLSTNVNEEEYINGLYRALSSIGNSRDLSFQMRVGALNKSKSLTWEKQIEHILTLIKSRLD